MSLFSKDVGIDLGTANTLVYMKGKGIIMREPSVVAVDTKSDEVRCVGAEAKAVIGRTPGSIVAVRPAGHCRGQVQRLTRTKQLFSQNKHAHMRQNFFIVHQRLKSTSIKRVWAPSQPSGTVLVSP